MISLFTFKEAIKNIFENSYSALFLSQIKMSFGVSFKTLVGISKATGVELNPSLEIDFCMLNPSSRIQDKKAINIRKKSGLCSFLWTILKFAFVVSFFLFGMLVWLIKAT